MEPGAKSPNYFNGIGEDDMEQEVCALSQIRDETSDRRPEHSHSHTQPAAATQKGLKLFKIRFPFLIQAVQCEYGSIVRGVISRKILVLLKVIDIFLK